MKRSVLFASIVLVPVMGFLLWPLQTDHWMFEWDENLIEGKSAYLDKLIAQPSSDVPNVLLIMVDDLSKADITMYESDAPVHTPHMDALAESGVRFDNAYVTTPICSPSRAGIITGRYPQRFGYEHQMHDRYLRNRLEYYAFRYLIDSEPWIPQYRMDVPNQEAIVKQGLPPSEITIGELMKKHGYETGIVGKWHLGESDHNQPCNMGFDYYYGFNASHSLYIPEGTEGYVDQKIEDDWTDEYIWSKQRNGPFGIFENCDAITEDRYLTDKIADESIAYMERNRDRPFFLWASFNAPHTPLQAPLEYVEMFDHVDDPVKRVHYAMIKSLDDAIGRVTDYLKSSELDSNTIVFLVGDNGGAHFNLTTENGDYKGGKITNFDGGLMVPMAMVWHDSIAAGTEYDPMVSALDIFGTIASTINAELPQDRGYDGVDLVEAVNTKRPAHDHLFWRMGYNSAVRSSDWKLIWNTYTSDTLLYHIAKDPFENNNLYGDRPAVSEQLFNAHEAWSSEMIDPLWPPVIHFTYTDDGIRYYFDN